LPPRLNTYAKAGNCLNHPDLNQKGEYLINLQLEPFLLYNLTQVRKSNERDLSTCTMLS